MYEDHVLLIDRLRCGAKLLPSYWQRQADPKDWQSISDWSVQMAKQAVIFQIDNVAEYFYAGTDKEEWHVEEDFPCISPPYPCFWMEYVAPTRLVSCVNGIQEMPQNAGTRCGFLFMTIDYHDSDDVAEQRRLMADPDSVTKIRKQLEFSWRVHGPSLTSKIPGPWDNGFIVECMQIPLRQLQEKYSLNDGETAFIMDWIANILASSGVDILSQVDPDVRRQIMPRWMMRAIGYSWFPSRGLYGPQMEWLFPIAADGSLWQGHCRFGACMFPGCQPPDMNGFGDFNPQIFPALMALTFLHCKNVTVQDKTPPPTLSNKREKRHGQPLVSYKVLQIHAMTEAIRRSTGLGTAQHGNPLHICRGHFKDYREIGLFGKHKGIYWWDHFIRGRVEQGVALKDYSVN